MSNLTLVDKAQGKWVLVEFCVSNQNELPTVSAIPGQWLVVSKKSLMAYFPEHFPYAKLKSAISKNVMYEKSWPIFEIKFVMPVLYDTYQEARKDEHDVEGFEGTDLEEFAIRKIERPVDKRTRKPQGHRHASGDSDVPISESDSCEEEPARKKSTIDQKSLVKERQLHKKNGTRVMVGNDCRKSVSLPPLPSPPKILKAASILERSTNMPFESLNLDDMSQQLESEVPSCSPERSSHGSSDTRFALLQSKENREEELTGLLQKVLDRQGKMVALLQSKENREEELTGLLLKVLDRQGKMEEKIEQSFKMLNDRINCCAGGAAELSCTCASKKQQSAENFTVEESMSFTNCFLFPIQTKRDLYGFNEMLNSDKHYKSFMVSYSKERMTAPAHEGPLQSRFNALANSILKVLIHNDLALQYNLKGRTNSSKDSFVIYSGVLDMIFHAMKEKLKLINTDISTEQSNHAVGEWLRQAKGRTEEAMEKRRYDQAERRKKQREGKSS